MPYTISFRNHATQLSGFGVAVLLAFGILAPIIAHRSSAQQRSNFAIDSPAIGNSQRGAPQRSPGGSIASTQTKGSRGVVRLPGEVPAALNRAMKLSTKTITGAPLTLTVVLRRTDQRGFDEFMAAVQDPKSPSFRHYLNPREQAARFGPTAQAYDRVLAWLRQSGFALVEGSANRLTLTVRASRKRTEEVFGVSIDDYRIGSKIFRANDHDPVIPTQLAANVQAVIGLSDLAKPQSSDLNWFQRLILQLFGKTSCEIEAINALSGCRTTPECDQIYDSTLKACIARTAAGATGGANGPGAGGAGGHAPQKLPAMPLNLDFNPTSSSAGSPLAGATPRWIDVDGTGQTVGLLEFDTFNVNDIRNYLTLAGFPLTRLNRLSQVHVNGGATLGPNESEVLIDIIAVLANAPGAQVVVYDAPFTGGTNTNFQTIFNRMISDGVTVIGNSWAYCEDQTTAADVQSLDSILASAAAAGISVFNASGDSGSTCLDGSANTVCVPADSPHATAVGGTSLTLGPAVTYGSETVWAGVNGAFSTGQGGFGVSRFFTRPAYQNGFNSSSMRSIPDVSVNADPASGIRICQADAGGCPTDLLYGGTSLSAPIWAAFGALLNQAQGVNLGNLNLRLYPLGNTSAFHSPAEIGSDFQHVGLGSPNLSAINLALSGSNGATPPPAAPVVGAVSPGVSQINLVPDRVKADDTSVGFVVVRLRDANGNTISGKTVTLTANPSAHITIFPSEGVSNVANGAVIFTIKSTTVEAVTFTATDTTDGIVLTSQPTVSFITPPAAAGGISANPTTVNANGTDTTTITVTLQDARGNPSPGKVVNLSQGNGASIISATTATTDATGKVQFTAVDNKAETVTYTAVDVSDGNLPVPGSAIVNFVNASGFCSTRATYNFGTAAPGYGVTTFASNFPNDCFTGIGPIGLAFDANGTLFVGDFNNNSIYRFGPQGGIAGPATLVGTVPSSVGAGPTGLTFTKDGRLYVGLRFGTKIVEMNPATGAVIRVAANLPADPLDLEVDPLSGDLFVSSFSEVYRITNLANGPGTVTTYLQGGFIDGFVFAPDGTIYLKGGTDGIFRVTGTNTPNPGTLTQLAFVGGGADGIAVEPNPANATKPFLYVNRNDGIITRLDTSNLPPVVNCNDAGAPCENIYTGGSRGDFVTVGPSGCLYATQSDRIIKITKADGSCNLSPTSSAPYIVLSFEGASSSVTQGTSATFTATLKNVTSPENMPITLRINGANTGLHLLTSDTNGNASFAYTGILTGTDEVVAFADLNGTQARSNSITLNWTPGKHSPFLGLNRSPAAGTTNRPLMLTATLADLSVSPVALVGGATVSFSLAGQTCMGTTDVNGNASCSITPTVAAGSYVLTATFSGTTQLLSTSASKTVTLIDGPPTTMQFSAANYDVAEGNNFATITVTRTGDTSGISTIDFASSDGTASQRRDYEVANGTITFAAGETSKTFRVLIVNDVYVESNETINLTLNVPTGGGFGAPGTATVTIIDNDSVGTISPISHQFVSNLVGTEEVPPTGNTVKGNGGVFQLSNDEMSAKVSLIFSGLTGSETGAHVHAAAPGVNGPIIFPLPLGNPINDSIFNPSAQQVIDLRAGQQYMNVHSTSFPDGEIRGQLLWNPAEEADFFVRQAYFDFLSRNPDPGGFAFWQNEITQCQTNVQCLRNKRVDVSNAFFYELEFQQTAAYVLRLYRAAYGNNQPFPNPNPNPGFPNEEKKLPSYAVFVADRARVIGGANLAQKQIDLANLFVTRPEFTAKYPLSLATADQFVDAVLATLQTDLGVNLMSQRANLLTLFNQGGRGAVMYRLADDNASNPIANQPFIDAEYNRTFVLGQYFGYLRRNPDIPGFLFWLGQVNGAALRDVPRQHAMVCSFITSAEYQFRFGPVASRNNTECPQ